MTFTDNELHEMNRGLLMRMDLLAKIASNSDTKQRNVAHKFGQIACDARNKILTEIKRREDAEIDGSDPSHPSIWQLHGIGSR